MRPTSSLLLRAIALCLTVSSSALAMAPFAFRAISDSGTFYRETMLPADIDKDGDMDFFTGMGRGNKSWWFERAGGGWTRRLVSDSNLADVGAAQLDVNRDGWPDKVSSGFWYRNPGFPAGGLPAGAADPVFTTCRYARLEYVHDIYAADMDKDGHQDIIAIDYDGIRWFKIPGPDSACGPWEEHMVNGYADPAQHGGIAAGDLDGDGDADISRLDRWFENAEGKGTVWIEHANIPFGTWYPAGWGLSGRALITDMDGDGHNDIVQTECDAPNGRVAWFGNRGGKGLDWVMHLVKDSTDGQDFHSLILADFDADGDLDLFSAGSGNSASPPQAYVWENLDAHGGSWREKLVLIGPQRTHDAAAADMDGDGDVDILAKCWGSDSQFYLENQQVPNPETRLRPPGGPGATASPNAVKPGRYLRGYGHFDAGGRRRDHHRAR